MTADELMRWLANAAEVCVCGKVIPDNAIYYGFPLSEDADEPMAFVNEWHDGCLAEWGWRRDNSDFGIAHMAAREVTEHTRVGTVIGTPHYMAPEQTLGAKVDGRTDLWAVGVILYHRRSLSIQSFIKRRTNLCEREPMDLGQKPGKHRQRFNA
jgi:hypothetical protein